MAERLVLAPESNPGPTVAVSVRDPLEGGDIDRWALDQAEFLRASRWDQVDLVNVADDIEDVGKRDYTTLDSKLEIDLVHILEWEHQPQGRSRTWSDSIFEYCLRIEKLSRRSPRLKRRLEAVMAEAYVDARRIASRQTSLPLSAFADICPYSLFEVMSTRSEFNEAWI